MLIENNRVAAGMQEWREREQNIKSVFSEKTPDTRYFKQLRLDYLRDLHRDIKKDATPDEKMALRILKGEIKDQEKELYPGKWERRLHRLIRAVKNLSLDKHEGTTADKTLWMRPADSKKEKEGIDSNDSLRENQQRYEKNIKQSIRRNDLDEEPKQSQRKGLRL